MNLIPPQYRLLAALVLLAVVAALGFGGGWAVNGWRLGTQVATVKQQHAQAVTDATTATLAQFKTAVAERDALALKLAGIDRAYSDQLRSKQSENDNLRNAVRTGTRVVRINGASCNPAGSANVPQAGAGSSVDSGSGAVLGADAGQAVLSIRAGALNFDAKLSACQSALSRITESPQ